MKLYTTLHIKLRGLKVPHRPVQLLGAEPGAGHGVQEVVPRHLARCGCHGGLVEQVPEDLEGARVDAEGGLLVVEGEVRGCVG